MEVCPLSLPLPYMAHPQPYMANFYASHSPIWPTPSPPTTLYGPLLALPQPYIWPTSNPPTTVHGQFPSPRTALYGPLLPLLYGPPLPIPQPFMAHFYPSHLSYITYRYPSHNPIWPTLYDPPLLPTSTPPTTLYGPLLPLA
jgi:hypothetical protein